MVFPLAGWVHCRRDTHRLEGSAMSHHREDLKGRGKEAAGDLTGDKDLEREGKIDQGSASIKDKVGKAADKVKDALNRD